MQDYIEKLTEALRELTGKPVTLGHAEEINVYAEALCAVKRLHGAEDARGSFDRETAMRWMEHMENADGSTGPHWAMEQTAAVADSLGIHGVEPWAWGVGVGRGHEHGVLGLLPRGRRLRPQPPGVLRSAGQSVFARQRRTGARAEAHGVL